MAKAALPSTLPALLTHLVETRGQHPALVTRNETLSFAELDRRSAHMARALLAAGAGKGERIGLIAPDGVMWITTFLASLRIGALLTAISTLAAPPELAHILKSSDCRFLIAARRFLGHDYGETLEAALPGLGESQHGSIRLADAPLLRAVWIDDADGLGWARPLDALLARADAPDAPCAEILAAIEREIMPSDEAVVVYTSGSTALPKPVVHHHWAVTRHPLALAENFAITPDDRMMPLLPAFWLAGLSTMLQLLCIGGTVVYPDTVEVDDALAMIEDFGVTRVNAWGDKQPRLIAAAQAKGVSLDHIPELTVFRDPQGQPVGTAIPMYGMTESFSAHSATPVNQSLPPGKEGSFGRAINGYERRVVDLETGEEVAPGEPGELQIRGPALMAGLYGKRRSEVFTADGFYPTSDIVQIDADGYLFPVGRRDDMIKTRGANVSRLEVEAALNALPDVATAVVAGLPDEEFGKVVAAAVVLAEGASSTVAGLQAALRDHLSSYKVPRSIVFIAEMDIPRTATGKVKLSETAAMIAARLTQ
ncbi:MAG: class I adenylate-forming enzyme family protein [Novosphingobium sp.]|nr:class I adenylate-forming enzyme family protein [Novosphingobium sp.]